MRNWMIVLGIGCGAWLSACDPDRDPAPVMSCDLANKGGVLDGQWVLSGTGRRSGCDDRELEGDLTLESEPIGVRAQPVATRGPLTGPTADSEADAFVIRIQRADYQLSLESDADPALGLQGGAVGSCVSFSLSEDLSGGDRLQYRFDGYITGPRLARGDFWGTGPESCEVTGTFELRVR